jgi:hypothetical protein
MPSWPQGCTWMLTSVSRARRRFLAAVTRTEATVSARGSAPGHMTEDGNGDSPEFGE